MKKRTDDKQVNGNLGRTSDERMQPVKSIIPPRRVRIIIMLTLLGLLVSVVLAQTASQQFVGNSGSVAVVGVSLFWDSSCTSKVASISWGTILPGTSSQKYVYIRNDGGTGQKLMMAYGNWTPAAAASYFTFSWNCSNYVFGSHLALVCARLTLVLASNVNGVVDFSFTIGIQGTL